MINNVNNQRFKTLQNYTSINKKPTPISIFTAENTIFIKKNQNKLTSNYLRNGNQIKQNKNYASTTINKSQKINNSLKNTFIFQKSNIIDNNQKKNTNNINGNINKMLKTNSKKINYRGTNSFIRIDRRTKNNLSTLNDINRFSNNNHLFNYYNMNVKLNNSSVNKKHKVKREIKKLSNSRGINLTDNIKDYYNLYHTIGVRTSNINQKSMDKTNSISKKMDTTMNKTLFFKKLNYFNNLSNLISSSNHDQFYYKTLNSYNEKDNENESNKIKRKLYYLRRLTKKYIYSIEKKKEKSLAEKRQKAKKPISYLIKNNFMNQINNKQNLNKKVININTENNELEQSNENNEKSTQRKNQDNKTINYKKKFYNLDNYDYNINIENENKNNKKIFQMKSSQINAYNYSKTLPNNNDKSIKTNKENLSKNNLNENNKIINNNYYNINNTFIFDNFGKKLSQYELTKLIAKNNNSSNINYSEINNYNSNIYKTIETDIDIRKNKIIKNLDRKIKKATKPIINNKIKKLNKNSINAVNKLKFNNLSNAELSTIINDKISKKYFQVLSISDKMFETSNNNKRIISKNNNIINNEKKKYTKGINQNKIKANKYKTIEAKDNSDREQALTFKSNLNLNNKNIISRKTNNHYSIYEHMFKKKKTYNLGNIWKNMKLNNDIINTSLNNKANNLNEKNKINQKNENNNKKEVNANNENSRKNKMISYKIINFKIKNKSYNIGKLNKLNIKEDESFEFNKNKNFRNNVDIKYNPKNQKEKENFNNLFFNEYENNDNYEESYNLETEEEIDIGKIEAKRKKQNSSFELISLSENNETNTNVGNQVKNEENFGDINSIIKKINFDKNENTNNDIFSINNRKYQEFDKIFEQRFEKWFNK